jgi:hypothetical protein
MPIVSGLRSFDGGNVELLLELRVDGGVDLDSLGRMIQSLFPELAEVIGAQEAERVALAGWTTKEDGSANRRGFVTSLVQHAEETARIRLFVAGGLLGNDGHTAPMSPPQDAPILDISSLASPVLVARPSFDAVELIHRTSASPTLQPAGVVEPRR